MNKGREIYFIDSSMLIHLHKGEILEEIISLPYKYYCTDFVEAEFCIPSENELPHFIQIVMLEAKQIERIGIFRTNYPRLSVEDISSIIKAKDSSARILTSDREMRKAAQNESIVVHGIFWILDELVNANIITRDRACVALKKVLKSNARLPQEECRERFRRWRCNVP